MTATAFSTISSKPEGEENSAGSAWKRQMHTGRQAAADVIRGGSGHGTRGTGARAGLCQQRGAESPAQRARS